ncbi:TetR/AcrR family transcriptional regulator, partial [Rhodococcus sp. Chr-9]|uniref:TetR/AcrR family transcriptional regulator n=1 Tax=Rhodococcus sp. Chr-9 TaxID=713612 RepID=UPI001F47CA5F
LYEPLSGCPLPGGSLNIAKAAGVGPGTLYRHFPNRDDLVLAVIDDGLLALAEQAEALLGSTEPVAALQGWLNDYVTQAGLFDGLARTLVDPEAGDDTTCKRSKRAGAALLERAVATGDVRDDLSGDDLLDMATAIAWLGEHGRGAEQRSRLPSSACYSAS